MNLHNFKGANPAPGSKPRAKRAGRKLLASTAIAAVMGTLFISAPATAADGQAWYYNDLGYDQIHAQGIDGEGVTIAVVEFGYHSDVPDLAGANVERVPLPEECRIINEQAEQTNAPSLTPGVTYKTTQTHGDNVASIIAGQGGDGTIQGIAPKAKLLLMEVPFINSSSSDWPAECDPALAEGNGVLARAEELGADIITFSVTDGHPDIFMSSYWLMRGKALVTYAGNARNVEALSAGQPGTVTVTATAPGNAVTDWAAVGPENTVASPGQGIHIRKEDGTLNLEGAGTSFSAPIVAGTLALGHQKWPDATYNQLIQSLTATASNAGTHTDELGYGAIDPVAFIENDPSQYPDEPITYPESSWSDPEWSAVRDVVTGFPLNEIMGNAAHYQQDAGIDPNYVEWLPQIAKDEGWLGATENLANPTEPANTTSVNDSASASESEGSIAASQAIRWVVFLLIVGLIVFFIVRRRKKRASANVQPPQFPQQGPPSNWRPPTDYSNR